VRFAGAEGIGSPVPRSRRAAFRLEVRESYYERFRRFDQVRENEERRPELRSLRFVHRDRPRELDVDVVAVGGTVRHSR